MNKKVGFTLVELIITVSIISIIASIALVQLANFRKRAFDTGSQVLAKDLLTAGESVSDEVASAGFNKMIGDENTVNPLLDEGGTLITLITEAVGERPFNDSNIAFSVVITDVDAVHAVTVDCRGNTDEIDNTMRNVYTASSAGGGALLGEMTEVDSESQGVCPS